MEAAEATERIRQAHSLCKYEHLPQRRASWPAEYRNSRQISCGQDAKPPHILKKYGRDISTTPTTTSKKVLETKYGKIINSRPQISGTTTLCFLP